MDLNISLPDDLARYIDAELDAGRFATSSEVIGAALRLLEAQNNEIDSDLVRLRAAWKEGIESADFQSLDFEQLKAEARKPPAAE